ncbi:MAG: response regulator transcription factor [bacterium]
MKKANKAAGTPPEPEAQNSSKVPLRRDAGDPIITTKERSVPKMNTQPIFYSQTPAAAATAEVGVALVEDDDGLRRSMERLLNLSPGFRCVLSCSNGEDALKLIPLSPPDLVLMDIHLPNRSGIECTALLRQQLPQLQIIMLTVYDDADTLFKALRAGACGYLLKRARPEEILEAISEALRGGAPMSSEIARQVVAAFQESVPSCGQDDDLSRREQEILSDLLRGFSNKDIAASLSLSVFTVKNHLRHIYEKLHVRSRTDVMFKFRDVPRPPAS